MPIFHKQAFLAAANGKDTGWLKPHHFADERGLGTALDHLCPEQRCDAIYADWLLQLNSPSRQALLQVRNLLIGQGALAANYLAEFAQNADDAADGQEAQIRIVPDGEWLIVSNNGRRVTSLNLLGLCRFFVHSAGQVIELNEQTIGRFGIGFKSCYRIASEVFVHTWDKSGSFGFRLPICRENDPRSHPDQQRLKRLLARLQGAGEVELDPQLRDNKYLGYCTPEFQADLPPALGNKTTALRHTERGTVFCLRIRSDKREEVARRISGQAHEVYELCPLFLPHLRLVQLGPNELKMQLGRRLTANDLPGSVQADRVVLTTESPGQPPSRSRFWRLGGVAPGDRWQIALHADHEHRLRVEREDDEQATTVREQAAYAYFPLNAVNEHWPFRLHLHIDLPTDLPRVNWNPDDADQVVEQIRRAVDGMAAWLERHTDKWHPGARIESFVERVPNPAERWAWLVWEGLLAQAKARPLLKTVWGNQCNISQGKTVRLIDREGARRNWLELCGGLHGMQSEFPIVDVAGVVDFGLEGLPDRQLRAFFLQAIAQVPDDVNRRRLVTALFTVETAEPDTLEVLAHKIMVPCLDGTSTSLAVLSQRPSGSELPDGWHETFRTLQSWLWDCSHGLTSFFNGQLRFQLKKLATGVFNPRWEAVPVVLGSEQAWQNHGAEFWQLQREACPASIRSSVIQSLRIRNGSDSWKPITSVWLVDSSPVNCFHGVVEKWERGQAPNNDAQRAIRQELESWGLWDAWQQGVEKRLVEHLPTTFLAELQAQTQGPFETVFSPAHTNSKAHLGSLGHRWQSVVSESEKSATHSYVRAHQQDIGEGRLLAVESQDLREVLSWTGRYAKMPSWLTPHAVLFLKALGNRGPSLEILTTVEINKNGREMGELLLGQFHRWRDRKLTQEQVQAIEGLLTQTPATLRGNWSVGLSNRNTVLLRDFLNPTAITGQQGPNNDTTANLPLLQLPARRWIRVEELPEVLRLIPSVAGGALQLNQLSVQLDIVGRTLPTRLDQVSEEVRADPVFQALLRSCGGTLMACRQGIDVRWLRTGEIVAELPDAPFAVKNGCVLTSRTTMQMEERQFTEVLSLYSRKGRESETFRRFQQQWQGGEADGVEIYEQFRQDILQTLLQTEVKDLGYREQHVIRELLQNAESAYDSKPGPAPPDRQFEFTLQPPASGMHWQGSAQHSGRHFNERLNTGEERDDIRLIVSTPTAEAPPTDGWVGRFNRGFKAVFIVAESVDVFSGPFRFSIQDMLLLNPASPQPNPAELSQQTRFVFRCTKVKALRLLGLNSTEGQQNPLPIFNPSSFVFLRRVNRIVIRASPWQWTWRITEQDQPNGWSLVEIEQSFPLTKQQFLVHRGELAVGTQTDIRHRFAVAFKLASMAADGLPVPLEKEWRKVRLTFETEDEFPLDILVNGDFETDSGRLGVRKSTTNDAIMAACLSAMVELCKSQLTAANDKQRWLAWADVLHLGRGEEELRQRSEHHNQLTRAFEEVRQFLCEHIPHAGGSTSIEKVAFPSPLLRRLQGYVESWGFTTATWIDGDIEKRVPESRLKEKGRLGLDDLFISINNNTLIDRIRRDIQTQIFQQATTGLDAVAQSEFERALRIVVPQPQTAAEPPEEWSVEDLWQWWQRKGMPDQDYTIDGSNWTLLYPGDKSESKERIKRIRRDLARPETEQGRRIWYRLLGLACLMSAGWGAPGRLRHFWQETLEPAPNQFWTRTAEGDFSATTKDLFSRLVLKEYTTLSASGEDAEFWRHVFYDVRKVHELVWQHEFADTVLRLTSDPGRAGQLPHFLRSGQLAGQTPWAGVLGQSAGAPLFFVVRELCRLGIATSVELRPLAFFTCTPVRRAAANIGWLDQRFVNDYRFESLAEASRQIYERLAAGGEAGMQLLKFYDIPLLHKGLTD